MNAKQHRVGALFKLQTFKKFQTFKLPWCASNFKSWRNETWKASKHWSLKVWKFEDKIEISKLENLNSQWKRIHNFKLWNFQTLKLWNFETSNFQTFAVWRFSILTLSFDAARVMFPLTARSGHRPDLGGMRKAHTIRMPDCQRHQNSEFQQRNVNKYTDSKLAMRKWSETFQNARPMASQIQCQNWRAYELESKTATINWNTHPRPEWPTNRAAKRLKKQLHTRTHARTQAHTYTHTHTHTRTHARTHAHAHAHAHARTHARPRTHTRTHYSRGADAGARLYKGYI